MECTISSLVPSFRFQPQVVGASFPASRKPIIIGHAKVCQHLG
jgi:hypothetical protein